MTASHGIGIIRKKWRGITASFWLHLKDWNRPRVFGFVCRHLHFPGNGGLMTNG